MLLPIGWFSALSQGFVVDGADFDGTNDYMTRGAGLSGAADSKLLTIAGWIFRRGTMTTQRILGSATSVGGSGTNQARVGSGTLDQLFINWLNTSGAQVLSMNSGATTIPSSAWTWFAISVDMDDAAKRHVYFNDTSVINVSTYTVGETLDFTKADWSIGASPDGTLKLNGGLADLNMWSAYINLSTEANRRLFFSASGKPVNPAAAIAALGTPLFRFHLDDGEAAANFATNDGGGGNFSVSGSLSTTGTSPSD